MKVFGLIGNPLDHSWSEKYFQEKFSRENITDCIYKNFVLKEIWDLPGLLRSIPGIYGLNVTIPFKKMILDQLDEIDPEAGEIHAVNCIKVKHEEEKIILKGYNTDKQAFKSSVLPLLTPRHTRALVLGSGGASDAVVYALKELNIESIRVSRRRRPGMIEYEQIDKELMDNCKLVVNATPVGMFPDTEVSPDIPYEFITQDHLLYDLVYNPEMTLFLRKGLEAGAQIKNGIEMLELQAELSWKIWSEL